MNADEALGCIIQNYCNKYGISISEFSRKSTVSRAYINRIIFKKLGKFGVSTTIQELVAKGMGITHAELLKQIKEIQNGNSNLYSTLQDENDLIIKINNKLKTLSNNQLKMVYGLISETNSNKLEELDNLLKNME